VREVAGCERRASIRLTELVEDWVPVCWLLLDVCACGKDCVEGSAGGVRGPEGEAMVSEEDMSKIGSRT
jgi:hypothetical protein